jgi:hypothetical protein
VANGDSYALDEGGNPTNAKNVGLDSRLRGNDTSDFRAFIDTLSINGEGRGEAVEESGM